MIVYLNHRGVQVRAAQPEPTRYDKATGQPIGVTRFIGYRQGDDEPMFSISVSKKEGSHLLAQKFLLKVVDSLLDDVLCDDEVSRISQKLEQASWL